MTHLSEDQIEKERREFEKEEWEEKIMERRKWHLGKEIPLPLIFAVVVQSIGIVWWARGLTSEVARLTDQIREQKEERYTQADARKDRDWLNLLIQGSREREAETLRRINNIEQDVGLLKQRTIK